jgi:hypothetical protein
MSYDTWKTTAPDPGSAGGSDKPEARTRQLWWESFRYAERHGYVREWLQAQRQFGKFAPFVAEADRLLTAKTGS